MENRYEINSGTLALIPINDKITRVVELENSFLVSCSIHKIVDNSCRIFGSSYNGRSEGTKTLLGCNYKAPIIVSEANSIIFFPTTSPRSEKCCWLSLNHIVDYKKKEQKSVVNFHNKQQLELDISYFVLENQYYKATMLESKLRKVSVN